MTAQIGVAISALLLVTSCAATPQPTPQPVDWIEPAAPPVDHPRNRPQNGPEIPHQQIDQIDKELHHIQRMLDDRR